MSDEYYMEVRGSMTRFEPLTEALVARTTEDGLTLAELTEVLEQSGLSVSHVVHDPGRVFENTFYADYEHGLYALLILNRQYMRDAAPTMLKAMLEESAGASRLQAGDWDGFYHINVPLPMLIYDFQRRYRDIPPDAVFHVWHSIYKRIDYSNNMWQADVLEYVFDHAPETKPPTPDADGKITLYRGMGALSTPAEHAISWSAHPGSALWFAIHSGRGTHIAVTRDILAYYGRFYDENEVILRRDTRLVVRYEDMIPAVDPIVPQLLAPALREFSQYGKLARRLGYPEQEGFFRVHGISHILRVLLLSLIYYHNSGVQLTEADRKMLIYFSLLHDIARNSDSEDDAHGDRAVQLIQKKRLSLKGLTLSKKELHIVHLIIRYHCRDDEAGIGAIAVEPGFTRKDKARVTMLYNICKDMDGLDRVRFNGLDYRQLRTVYGRRLPLVAGCLLKETLVQFLDSDLS